MAQEPAETQVALQAKPLPNMREPSLSSLLMLASNWTAPPNHFEPKRLIPLRWVSVTMSCPVPGVARRDTVGVVDPAPCRLVLMVYGLGRMISL